MSFRIMTSYLLTFCIGVVLLPVGGVLGWQSVFSCPLSPASVAGIPGTLTAYAGALGEVCGTGSFIHYWTCCEDYPFECCFNFQTWAIVFLAALAVIIVAVLLFALGRFIIAQQQMER